MNTDSVLFLVPLIPSSVATPNKLKDAKLMKFSFASQVWNSEELKISGNSYREILLFAKTSFFPLLKYYLTLWERVSFQSTASRVPFHSTS